ncbi:hypothetical protein [Vibrio phage VpV262]|uniref:Portal protein n=1 Tax=Vibrio phage VpV262 TaxID=2907796 RepID=Q8LT44_9CAUD|nr:head-tail adaptor [Vibrio phage VpV262]AAM28399.1 hypothetical protein [Vibrio phage VpV262]
MSTDIKTLQKMLEGRDDDRAFIDELVVLFTNMENARAQKDREDKELMDYIDATDTRKTSNSKLPFKNSTTINKLAHLHLMITTSYMEHLLPNRNWVDFVGFDNDSVNAEKREIARSYVRGKVEASNLEGVIERMVDDFAVRGFCVAHTRHVKRMTVTAENQVIKNYSGTVTERLSPSDVFWDVTADSLPKAAKCIRQLYTLGSLKREIEEGTFPLMSMEDFQKLREERRTIREALADGYNGRRKFDSLHKKGYGSMMNYINEGVVEVLTFMGDFYDEENDELWNNYEITVIDRKIIGRKQSKDTWDGSQNLHIAVYEFQKDTLCPIGPLHRLTGMQYKLDKRENFREDLHDRFLHPSLKKVGDVREKGMRGGPNHVFEVEETGDVQYMTPPAEVLQPDNQLSITLQLMEDLSGAPKESIGQRTAGEKTKFEVQLLDQGQNKVFRRKVKKFERELLTPVLNDYLEQGRNHLDASDTIKTFNSELGTATFLDITADDLNLNGQMVAQGATLFAEKANTLQNLNAILGGPLGAALAPHMSRTKLFNAVEYLGDLDAYGIFTFGIGVQEDQQLARMAQKSTQQTEETALTQEEVGGPTTDTGQ